MRRTFETDRPTLLHVELGAGRLHVRADDVAQTTVDVDGPGADRVAVERQGGTVTITQPMGRGLLHADAPTVAVTLPRDSRLVARVGRAGVDATGRLGSTRVKSGSGHVHLEEVGQEAVVDCGSGDIIVTRSGGTLRLRSGSGRIEVGRADADVVASSGSGAVTVGSCGGSVSLKSGSGAVAVQDAGGDVALTSGSGDVVVGRIARGGVAARAASGDVTIGIPPGTPVWTDVTTVSGAIHSTLVSAGRPAPGQDFVEVRARTVSGDVHLAHV